MNNFILDKSDWKKVALGEITEDIAVRIDNPAESGYDRFVGLEHFVSGDLKIKTWSSTENLVSAAKEFKSGDVLFARRNAYLRRASLVEFDGICSGDAFVLRENHKKIVPGFLAFIVNSEPLWYYANANAAGTMSKRVKWRDLAQFQFLLPPKDQQARLAELLWAGDAVVEGYDRMRNVLKSVKSAYFDTVYCHTEVKTMSLGDCLEYSQYGISESLSENGEIPVLRMNNIVEGKVTFDDLKYVDSKSIPKLETLMLKKGDILFNRTNSFDLVGKVGIVDFDESVTFASYLIRLKANDKIVLSQYLNLYLNSTIGQRLIRIHRTPGVSQSNINPENLKKIDVPILPISKQEILIEKINSIENAEVGYKALQINSKAILDILLNQIFTP